MLPEVVTRCCRGAPPMVRRYVDLDALVAEVDLDAVAARLDVVAVVARVDLDAVAAADIDAVVDRLDLTETVLARVDLKAVVDAVLDQSALPSLGSRCWRDRPARVIRDSTGTMASETVRSARMHGVTADEAVSRRWTVPLGDGAWRRSPTERCTTTRTGTRPGTSCRPSSARAGLPGPPRRRVRSAPSPRPSTLPVIALVCLLAYVGYAGLLFLVDPRTRHFPDPSSSSACSCARFVPLLY